MRQVKELFAQMRNVYRKLEFDAKNLGDGRGEQLLQGAGAGGVSAQLADLERRKTLLMRDGVGELEEIGEFGLGIAPSMSKPINKIEISKQREEEINKMMIADEEPRPQSQDDEEDPEAEIQQLKLKQQRQKKRKPTDRQTAFLEFKSLPEGGRVVEDQILSNRQELKEEKHKVKQYTDACNMAKKELDTIKGRLDAKEQEKRVTLRQDMMGYEDEDMDGQPVDGRGSG